ncbi:hypothetical protein QBC46DRAFT_440350 [Diplogelasinospora grovesii]|uniref:Uncharacterized protein n=1 Tax=Diplogelasinospora grovesii TaxID=303347 RepID=A0AAN6N3B5_9PEZI|nr:hypothetical protein QBC46DRAFT_440350 [Diplogelasinospora grovesii]
MYATEHIYGNPKRQEDLAQILQCVLIAVRKLETRVETSHQQVISRVKKLEDDVRTAIPFPCPVKGCRSKPFTSKSHLIRHLRDFASEKKREEALWNEHREEVRIRKLLPGNQAASDIENEFPAHMHQLAPAVTVRSPPTAGDLPVDALQTQHIPQDLLSSNLSETDLGEYLGPDNISLQAPEMEKFGSFPLGEFMTATQSQGSNITPMHDRSPTAQAGSAANSDHRPSLLASIDDFDFDFGHGLDLDCDFDELCRTIQFTYGFSVDAPDVPHAVEGGCDFNDLPMDWC